MECRRGAAVLGRPERRAGSPDGKTVYVANIDSNSVTPISTAQPARPAHQGRDPPRAIVFTPDGRTAYVLSYGSGTRTLINTATNTPGRPIRTAKRSLTLAITP
jgi:DNA-binding beta-propeller fold protein YncE